MAFLLAIGSAIGVVIAILWRLNQAGEAARGTMAAAKDMRGMARGFFWRRKATAHPMTLIEDPREAVTAMMVAVAEHDGAMTQQEQTTILTQLTSTFEASAAQADTLLAQGRWLAKDVHDLAGFLRRPLALLNTSCDQNQKSDIIVMLHEVAKADGSVDDVIANAIAQLARSLGN